MTVLPDALKRLSSRPHYLAYALSLLFIAINTILISREHYWLSVLPVAAALVLYYIYSLDKILLIITFLTPLSITITQYDVGLGVSLPTEPLMALVLLVFLIKLLMGSAVEKRLVMHPVSIVILLMLAWMFITSLTSEYPLVSFKYLLSRLWFVIPFFFMAVPMFRERRMILWFIWLYGVSLAAVVVYSSLRLYSYGFDQQAAHWVMDPFYNDHTAYGAIVAMFLPLFFGLSLGSKARGNVLLAYLFITAILSTGLILSMSRAAWVSAVAALGVFAIIRFRVRFTWLALGGAFMILLMFAYQDEIMNRLEKNRQDSSADFKEHVQSISNIKSDASNLERINRWKAAFRMFEERPISGWGPGTYQFVYAPYQRTYEKTIISTNAGDLGNVHSEYLGPLSEWGFPGFLIVVALVVLVIRSALRVLRRSTGQNKVLAMVLFLGLVTYFVHGLLNNFLDTDKLSVPFWGFIAAIVSMDLYGQQAETSDKNLSR
jgi:putative inorganic carbon (hco3(-)) transporter